MKKSAGKTSQPPTSLGHISFGKVGIGPDGERFIRIAIKVGERRRKTLLRYDDLVSGGKAAIARLNRLGAHLITQAAGNEFFRRLQDLGPQNPSFKVATRVGPFGDVFVLPDQVVSATGKTVATSFDDNLTAYLAWGQTGGTLDGWRELEKFAEGNSRLILALGLAFVGPLRLIAPVEPFSVNLTGRGGRGKTIIGACASSIWGQRALGSKPHPLCAGDAWNTTLNNLERVLATRDHTFLFLNEGHHVKPDDLVAAIFLICEGQGKGRYTEIRRWEWFVPVFSTSNQPVAETLQNAGEPLERAAFDRLIDVPLPQEGIGAFENLHGSAKVGKFSRRLMAIYDANFGLVGRAYVLKILEALADDKKGLATSVEEKRAYFIRAAHKSISASAQHERVISHFATIYAALRLARQYRLFKLNKGSARKALLACLKDHLRVTDGVTASVVADGPVARLKAYVLENRAKFVDLDKKPLPKGHDPDSCSGYIYRAEGRTWVGLRCRLVERIIGGRKALKTFRRALNKLGVIRSTGSAKGDKRSLRYAVKVQIGPEREYLCSVDAKFFN